MTSKTITIKINGNHPSISPFILTFPSRTMSFGQYPPITKANPKTFDFGDETNKAQQLMAILSRNGLKFDWLQTANGGTFVDFVAGVGSFDNPTMVWFPSNSAMGMGDLYFINCAKSIPSNIFLQYTKNRQDALVTGKAKDSPPVFKTGDIVKIMTSRQPLFGEIANDSSNTTASYTVDVPPDSSVPSTIRGLPIHNLEHADPDEYQHWLTLERSVEWYFGTNGYIPIKEDKTNNKPAYDVSNLGLTSLKGLEKATKHGINAADNPITSLVGLPNVINGNLNVGYTVITDLTGAPQLINGDFIANYALIQSFNGASMKIKGYLYLKNCMHLTSLKDIHKHITEVGGVIELAQSNVVSHILGLFLIKGLQTVRTLGSGKLRDALTIVNKYLPLGKAGLVKCQLELISNGLDEFAQI